MNIMVFNNRNLSHKTLKDGALWKKVQETNLGWFPFQSMVSYCCHWLDYLLIMPGMSKDKAGTSSYNQ